MKVLVGIPARLGASRFPRKPLCDILGKPMIEHVYRRCAMAPSADLVFVAACEEEVRTVVTGFGGTVVMTDPAIERPGLRVAAALGALHAADDDIVLVAQGDEPMLNPEMIDLTVRPLLREPEVFCSNLMATASEADWQDPNEVKVVVDHSWRALFMSRSPIPSRTRDLVGPRYRQLGIFAFRKRDMLAFQALATMPLEQAESIEMNRAIEHGRHVRMVLSPFVSKSVDTDEDRREVVRLMPDDPIWPRYAAAGDGSV